MTKPHAISPSGADIGTGKTSSLAWLILWVGLFFDDAKLPATAPVSDQLRKLLIPEVGKWKNKMYPKFRGHVEVMTDDVKFKNGNWCFARTARKENTEAIAGVHASFVLYIADEASGIDQAVFDTIEGGLTGGKYLFVMTSNPTRNTGTFYDSHNKKRSHYQTLHFDSTKSSNVDTAWVNRMREKYGEESDVYRVRVLGEFPKSNASGLFGLDVLERAMDRVGDKTGAKIFGVDVARFGDDSSMLSQRHGLQVLPFQERTKLSTIEVSNWIMNEHTKAKADGCVVDTIGVGAGVFDQLQNRGVYVTDGNFGMKADDPETYMNKRAECYFRLKESLDRGLALPRDDGLVEELLSINYSFTETGKIKIQPKDQIKEELGRSPDKADALALTFFTTFYVNQDLPAWYTDDVPDSIIF